MKNKLLVFDKKTNPKVRQELIELLDRENAWEHVIMNYLSYIPRRDSGVSTSREMKMFHAELNRIIDHTMMSWQEIRDWHDEHE